MPKTNQTLERLTSPGDGLITNPGFQRFHSIGPDGALTSTRIYVGPGVDVQSGGGLPAGWLPFGEPLPGIALSATEIGLDIGSGNGTLGLDNPPASFGLENPTYKAAGNAYPGVGIGSVKGRVSGIMQRIPNAPALLGRKLRIYGAYKVTLPDLPQAGAPVATGISIWVRGKVHKAISVGGVLTDVAGATPATLAKGSNSLTTSPGASFVNLLPGDTIWISGNNRVYQVATVTPPNLTIEGVAPFAYAGDRWTAGRQQPNGIARDASWHGARGVHLTKGANGLPAAVLRVADPAASFHEGMEWYTPGLDRLAYPADGNSVYKFGTNGATDVGGVNFTAAGATFLSLIPNSGGTPLTEAVVIVPGQGTYDVVDIVSNTQLEVSPAMGGSLASQRYIVASRSTLSDADITATVLLWGAGVNPDASVAGFYPGAAPPGLNGGAATTVQQAAVWYLDSTEWSGTPSNGNKLLLEQTEPGYGDVRYFDQVVDIPDDLTLTEDEAYLLVMPLSPDDINDIDTMVSTYLYYLQAEVVSDSASGGNGTEARILKAVLAAEPYGLSFAKGSANLPLREPIWVPVEFSLDLGAVQPSDFDFTKLNNLERISGGFIGIGDGSAQFLSDVYWFPFPELPIGTVLEYVNIKVAPGGNTIANDLEYSLVQAFGNPPAYSAGTVMSSLSSTFSDTGTPSNVKFSLSSSSATIYRHRLGVPWPTSDTLLPGALAPTTHAPSPARFFLSVAPLGSDTWKLRLQGVHCRAWVDARALRGQVPFYNSAISP